MRFVDHIRSHAFSLSEGSIYERLRRNPSIAFDPQLAHATLIYDSEAAKILQQVHQEYLDVGQKYQLAMFALTDTWRASQERIDKSEFRHKRVNQDNAAFLDTIRTGYNNRAAPIYLGGLLGPKGDAYKPEESPPRDEAEEYHTPQIEALAESNIDFLYASTMPAFAETLGMAAVLSRTELPYVLSFVVRPNGRLLDNTPLDEVVREMDSMRNPPTGYAINCVHPSVFSEALSILKAKDESLLSRLLSFQANTSAKRPEELDALEELETEEPQTLAELMVGIQKEFKTVFMGGCCGTSTAHIECLAQTYQNSHR